MTSAQSADGPSAAKIGGITLIGLGALAAVFGVATAVSGGSEPTAAPQPGRVPPPAVTSEAPAPSAEPPAPVIPPPSPAQPPATSVLPPPETAKPVPGNADQGTTKIVIRVYNNSTIKGLANRAADDFRQAGYDVPEVGNYPGGKIYTTTVYFRPGTEEEAQAREVAERIGARVEPRFEGIQSANPGVIAIITNDYKGLSSGK